MTGHLRRGVQKPFIDDDDDPAKGFILEMIRLARSILIDFFLRARLVATTLLQQPDS